MIYNYTYYFSQTEQHSERESCFEDTGLIGMFMRNSDTPEILRLGTNSAWNTAFLNDSFSETEIVTFLRNTSTVKDLGITLATGFSYYCYCYSDKTINKGVSWTH